MSFPRTVEPGHEIGTRAIITNLTRHRVHLDYEPDVTLAISKGGTQVWTTGHVGLGGPVAQPFDIAARHSKHLLAYDAQVRWDGHLTVQASCGLHIHLPAAHLMVRDPGSTPSTGVGLAAAIGKMAGVFDHCTPSANTAGVDGTFAAPDPKIKLPPLDMHCWAAVRQEGGFDLVDLFLVTPHTAPRAELSIDPRAPTALPSSEFMQAGHWQFVVTHDETLSTGSFTAFRSPRETDNRLIEFTHKGDGWHSRPRRCGLAGSAPGILLDWMNRCFA